MDDKENTDSKPRPSEKVEDIDEESCDGLPIAIENKFGT